MNGRLWILAGVILLILAGMMAWNIVSSLPDRPHGTPVLPGTEPSLILGRGAVVAEGDAADPLELAEFTQAGRELPAESWSLDLRWRAMGFFEGAEAVNARIKTRHRSIEREIDPAGAREPVVLAEIGLELPETSYQVPDTAMAFSPDGSALAIGSASGELKVVPFRAEQNGAYGVLNLNIPEGLVKDVAFAAGGTMLLAGEQSSDAFVYGLRPKTGDEAWKIPLADDLGRERSRGKLDHAFYSFPVVVRILPLPDGDALVLGRHSWIAYEIGADQVERERKMARSRLYRIDAKTGQERWRWPKDGPLPKNLTWMSASADGARVVLTASAPGAGQEGAREDSLDLVVVDGQSGLEAGRLTLEALKPHFPSTSSWQSLALLPDGSAGVLGAADGRVWAFDLDAAGKPSLRWSERVGTPVETGGTAYHCSVGWAAAHADGFCVTLGESRVKFGTQAPPGGAPDVHPEAMTVQGFSARSNKAERLFRYDAPGDLQGLWLSHNGRWLAFAYQKHAGVDASGQPAPPDYGVCMLDLQRNGSGAEKLVWKYATEGPLFFLGAFSPCGRYLAVAEGPRSGKDKLTSTRTYRVLLLH